nr:hypothetical protein [Tanacetum cinerariifolium]
MKPKRMKDSTSDKEKMLPCKQAEKGVPLQAQQADWLEDTDEEIKEQELEAHYSFMAKIHEVPIADSRTDTEPLEQVHNDAEYNVFANVRQHSEQLESTSNTCLVEKDDSNVTPNSPDMCDNDIQSDQNTKDKRAALANLIANLKLDVDENKKVQKQLKKANASLAHELKECKSILAKTSRTLREDRPPMLATERYAQWKSYFLRYIDTRPNGDALRKCMLEGPYKPTTVTIPAVPATENSPAILERTAVETILTMSPENKAHYESEKEAIHLLFTGIGDEIYLTVDACEITHKIWIAIKRIQ